MGDGSDGEVLTLRHEYLNPSSRTAGKSQAWRLQLAILEALGSQGQMDHKTPQQARLVYLISGQKTPEEKWLHRRKREMVLMTISNRSVQGSTYYTFHMVKERTH